MEPKSDKAMVSMSDMSPVTLFQAVSKSSGMASPIMKVEPADNHTLFVHYMEQAHQMLFHWLNIFPNTTNTEFIQQGYRDISFGTKIYCETINFTRVSFEKYIFRAALFVAIEPSYKFDFVFVIFKKGSTSPLPFLYVFTIIAISRV